MERQMASSGASWGEIVLLWVSVFIVLVLLRCGGGGAVCGRLAAQTRLAILAKLSEGPRLSIVRLTAGSSLTRQAITKHLRVPRRAGLVRGARRGRERLFQLEPAAIDEARRAL